MIADTDIQRAARELVKRYGDSALVRSELRERGYAVRYAVQARMNLGSSNFLASSNAASLSPCSARLLSASTAVVNVCFWLKAAVQRCPCGLPLLARKQTFVPQCPVFGRLLLLHPGERTRR